MSERMFRVSLVLASGVGREFVFRCPPDYPAELVPTPADVTQMLHAGNCVETSSGGKVSWDPEAVVYLEVAPEDDQCASPCPPPDGVPR